MDKIGHFLGDKYRDIAKGFMTVLKESKFYEEGVLTPEEFVKAGNYLTSKCPTWKWCSNKKNISPSDYLPKEKQFLQTTVPCILRVKDFDNKSKYSEKIVEDDWCETNFDYIKNSNKVKEFNDKELNYDENTNYNNSNNKTNIVINEDYLDGIEIITNDLKIDKKEDEFMVIDVDDNSNQVVKSRTYDVTITYDFYYRVPRLWLIGYSENGNPLTNDEIKEDIMLEYIDKTVTMETHPNTGVNSISIHPCRHSLLIKSIISQFEKSGKKLEVEKSILVFLKFLSSVVPTIKYDFTMDIDY